MRPVLPGRHRRNGPSSWDVPPRSGFSLPVVAITGSNGKTTLTQMIASIFAQAYGERDGRNAWLATRGNLNNDIGLPLMLFELSAHHRAAVFELGMNRAGG